MASGTVKQSAQPIKWHFQELGGTGNTSLRVTRIPWTDVGILIGIERPVNYDSYAFVACMNAGGYFMRTGYVTTSNGYVAFSVEQEWGFIRFIYALKSENPHLW